MHDSWQDTLKILSRYRFIIGSFRWRLTISPQISPHLSGPILGPKWTCAKTNWEETCLRPDTQQQGSQCYIMYSCLKYQGASTASTSYMYNVHYSVICNIRERSLFTGIRGRWNQGGGAKTLVQANWRGSKIWVQTLWGAGQHFVKGKN